MDDLKVSPGITIPAAELSWSAARAGGPGGQNVNKVATKVDLRFNLAQTSALPSAAKARLRQLAGSRVDGSGVLRIVSQRTRDQSRNLEDARAKLATLIRQALLPPTPRRPTRPTRGSKQRRLRAKRKQGEKKTARRRVDPSD